MTDARFNTLWTTFMVVVFMVPSTWVTYAVGRYAMVPMRWGVFVTGMAYSFALAAGAWLVIKAELDRRRDKR